MEFQVMLYFLLFLAIIFFFYTKTSLIQSKERKTLPPSPPSLPIVGHLHLFKYPEHRSLESLATRYGPMLYLRLGRCRVVVVSSSLATEECFTRNDILFADRPKLIRGEIIYNYTTTAWAPYGELWRKLRRVGTIEAFSMKRVSESACIREEEVRFVSRERLLSIDSGWKKVNLIQAFSEMTKNVVMKVLCGKRWKISDNFNTITDPMSVPQMMSMYDFFPILRWIRYKGLEKQMKKEWKILDDFLENLLTEAKNHMNNEPISKIKTLAQEFLNLQKKEPEFYTDDIVKGLFLINLIGGTDSATRTMEWAMSLLLNHPTVLSKSREEIDAQVGPNRLVSDSDLQNLPYLRCIVNETLRLFPVSPFLGAHRATADTTILGYHIPKDTTLIVNAWALHRNPKVWEDPLTFKPERFQDEHVGKDSFKLMPFGFGRRACPGENLALKLVMLVLATCVQCFEWETVDGAPVDMEELGRGLTLWKKVPLHAVCRPRPSMVGVLSTIIGYDNLHE